MKYQINPCGACVKKYERGECNVNDLNNCCYETLAAFSGTNSVNSLYGTEGARNCEQCIYNKLRTMGPFPEGRSFCTMNVSPPPIFIQVPHFVPRLINEGNTVQEAVKKCLIMCENTREPYACKSTCITDGDAVVLPTQKSTATPISMYPF